MSQRRRKKYVILDINSRDILVFVFHKACSHFVFVSLSIQYPSFMLAGGFWVLETSTFIIKVCPWAWTNRAGALFPKPALYFVCNYCTLIYSLNNDRGFKPLSPMKSGNKDNFIQIMAGHRNSKNIRKLNHNRKKLSFDTKSNIVGWFQG